MTISNEKKTILAWKFIYSDHKLRYADKRELRAGETLTGPLNEYGKPVTKPVLCAAGFHASVSARDALRYAGKKDMTHIARVEIGGEVVTGDDKIAGTEIKCLWLADATLVLRRFMVHRRRAQMVYRLRGQEPSLAALWAIDVAERFVLGEADEDERQAAVDAAYAAYAAANAAATYAAANAADAAAAAYDAAAAYAAANAADAAYDAAYAAADAADADAERKAADEELTEALLALEPK